MVVKRVQMVVRKSGGPILRNRRIMDVTVDCNTLVDVLGQHFKKNFRLHHIFLQEIARNTNKALLKYQNGWFSIMSMHSCNLKFVVISHIYTLFQCCLFNLSAFRVVVLEFWQKTRNGLKLIAAQFRSFITSGVNKFWNTWPFSKIQSVPESWNIRLCNKL